MTGLYIHIPFCVQKCRYCDFLSFPNRADVHEAYVEALLKEIPKDRHFDTVFIGGGTPSTLPEGSIARILGRVDARASVEVTIEVNPGTVNEAKLNEYREAGVTRLSVGAQVLNDEALKRLGRVHKTDDVFKTVLMARALGYDNINLDLMYAIPGESVKVHRQSVNAAAQTGVEHISMYSLIVEEGTPLARDVEAGAVTLPDEDDEWSMEHDGREILERRGYARYEVSNYARPGFECMHNTLYWQGSDFIGVGLGASGAVWDGGRVTRTRNTCDIDAYIRGENAREVIVEEGADAEMTYLLMALRLIGGFPSDEFARRFGHKFSALNEHIIRDGKSIRLTERGMDIMNSVLAGLME